MAYNIEATLALDHKPDCEVTPDLNESTINSWLDQSDEQWHSSPRLIEVSLQGTSKEDNCANDIGTASEWPQRGVLNNILFPAKSRADQLYPSESCVSQITGFPKVRVPEVNHHANSIETEPLRSQQYSSRSVTRYQDDQRVSKKIMAEPFTPSVSQAVSSINMVEVVSQEDNCTKAASWSQQRSSRDQDVQVTSSEGTTMAVSWSQQHSSRDQDVHRGIKTVSWSRQYSTSGYQDEYASEEVTIASHVSPQVCDETVSQDLNCTCDIQPARKTESPEICLQYDIIVCSAKDEADQVAITKRSQVICLVPRGGYEHQFVEVPPDMFVCKICHHPSREPYLSVCCGHTFCKSCLDKIVCLSCPMCRERPFTTVPNKQNERAIKSLFVFCINREKGCNWQGEVYNINDHLENSKGCQFEDVICFNQCGATFERWYLSDHTKMCPRRMVNCQYCGIAGEHQFIEGEHKEMCPKFPLPCPNSCGVDNIFRKDVENHRNNCPLEEVTCSQQCGIILQRQSLAGHIEGECPCREVECQYCLIKGEHQFIERNHKEECPKFPLPCSNACEVSSMPRENINEHRRICPLEVVQCEYYGVGCDAKIVRKDKKAHEAEKIEEHLLLTKSKLACLESTFERKLKVLEAQLEQKTQFINDMLFKSVFWVKTLSAQTLTGVITNKSLPLTFKIADYTKGAKDNVTYKIEHYIKHPNSRPSRYQNANLIYVQLHLFPAARGDGEGSHLSAYLCATNVRSRNSTTAVSGNGHNLKLKLEVLNQINDSEHQSVYSHIFIGNLTVENMKTDWNSDCVISNDTLYKTSNATCQYLRDDCVFFRLEYSLSYYC